MKTKKRIFKDTILCEKESNCTAPFCECYLKAEKNPEKKDDERRDEK